MEQLEEILSLPRVDMIQWGAADYTISVGRPGQWTSPETKAVEKRVFETALKMGVPPRCEISFHRTPRASTLTSAPARSL